jgi:hypothetical protein
MPGEPFYNYMVEVVNEPATPFGNRTLYAKGDMFELNGEQFEVLDVVRDTGSTPDAPFRLYVTPVDNTRERRP